VIKLIVRCLRKNNRENRISLLLRVESSESYNLLTDTYSSTSVHCSVHIHSLGVGCFVMCSSPNGSPANLAYYFVND